MTNTIVAFNNDMNGEHDCNRRDLTTTLTSGGGNIFGDTGTNCAMYFTATGDRLSTDPGVASGPPADHGGATATTSPAPARRGRDGHGDRVRLSCRRPARSAAPTGACDVGAVQMPRSIRRDGRRGGMLGCGQTW